jgi:hypothetical protein
VSHPNIGFPTRAFKPRSMRSPQTILGDPTSRNQHTGTSQPGAKPTSGSGFYGRSGRWSGFVEDAAAGIRQRPDYQQQLAAAKGLDPSMTKKSLKLTFALVGSVWSPTTIAADLPRFKTMADVRGDLSHGAVLAADQLPTPDVLSVLEHYMRLIYGV